MIVLVTGGARSGKSRHAQQWAQKLTSHPVYVATARRWDEDFEKRIARHQQDRGAEWTSYETEKYVSALSLENKIVVVDCITLWLTNFFLDHGQDIDKALQEFKTEIDNLHRQNNTWIIVTNEIGMGVHAEGEVARRFVDLQGWANQYVASLAQEVVLMVSGIPVTVKSAGKLSIA